MNVKSEEEEIRAFPAHISAAVTDVGFLPTWRNCLMSSLLSFLAAAFLQARGRDPESMESLARASEAHGGRLHLFRSLPQTSQRRLAGEPRPNTFAAADEALAEALKPTPSVQAAVQHKGHEAEKAGPTGGSSGEQKNQRGEEEVEEMRRSALWRTADVAVVFMWRAVVVFARVGGRMAVRRRQPLRQQ